MKLSYRQAAVPLIAALAVQAAAEPRPLEEIVVTAQKREQGIQDVPISVNAVSGEKIAAAGITNLEAMTAYVPNLTMNQTGIGTVVAIRGISSGVNQGFEQSVGQYVDGIYFGRAQLARAPFMDLERVEVLRGPQGILFGKNSIAGAISMTTAKPTAAFEGSLSALYEPDHGEQDLRLVVSGPLNDNLWGRLAVMDRTIDGYFDNTVLNRDESDEQERVIRGSLRWQPHDDWRLDLKIETAEFDTRGRFMETVMATELPGGTPYSTVLNALSGGRFSLDTDQDFRRQSNGDTSDNETENLTLIIDYQLGDNTLTLTSGYNAYEYTELCDCDFIGATIFNADTMEDFEQFSQEVRFTSPEGATLDYIAGFFYQTGDLMFEDAINVPADSLLPTALLGATGGASTALAGTATAREFEQDSDLWALFAQLTWNLDERNRVVVGGRFTREQKEASRRQFHLDAGGNEVPLGSPADTLNVLYGLFKIEPYETLADDRDETAFTPLLTYQHTLGGTALPAWVDEGMLYATYTTGFKSGGFDVRSNAHPDPAVVRAVQNTDAGPVNLTGVFEYEEEEAQSFEVGGKFTFAEGAAELNLALYFTEFEDLQTSQFDGTLGFNVTNASNATVRGLELDGRWRAADRLTLSGAFAYLDFEYDSFPNAQCYFGQTPDSTDFPGLCDISGRTRELAPEFQASLSADFHTPVGDNLAFSAVLDLIYSDDYLVSPTLDPRLQQTAYTKVNARVALAADGGEWEVALVGRNLTDEAVINFGNAAPVSAFLTGGGGTVYYAFFDRPRSLALQATLRF
ncbi:TonB-dependent receptor [Exilibacterium tricleocarpae]|uniref:TonB-dependent receptor n=1 Tax=Exilibacterium tricleocarpae TaxID=2591008 RepID=A0A545TQ92_9GAMM|nr:TonB-dependent receptor [Exilibacterium tricleocarpae]TQV79413.1 TonB-dependent receptor [Exilibacterium tricleocarpae]